MFYIWGSPFLYGDYRTEMGRETRIFPYGESPFPNRVCFHLGINIYTFKAKKISSGNDYGRAMSPRESSAEVEVDLAGSHSRLALGTESPLRNSCFRSSIQTNISRFIRFLLMVWQSQID
jgi:hypothetical protein